MTIGISSVSSGSTSAWKAPDEPSQPAAAPRLDVRCGVAPNHHNQIHRDLPSSGASGSAKEAFRAAVANPLPVNYPYNRACPLEVSPHFCFVWIRPIIMGCMHLMCFAPPRFPILTVLLLRSRLSSP